MSRSIVGKTALSGVLAVVGLSTAACFAAPAAAPAPAAPPAVIASVQTTSAASPPPTSPAAVAATVTAAPAATAQKGLDLGSYSLTLPRYGGAPLGTSQPSQAEVLAHSNTYANAGRDVVWESDYGGEPLGTGTGDQILSLPTGTTPTYQACASTTLAVESTRSEPGTAFCVLETTGDMAGVTVRSVSTSNPENIVLDVVVWQN